jgi:hypothetical protein
MATPEPAVGRQKSREELSLELTDLRTGSAKPKPTQTAACSVEVITSGPEFGEPESKPQQKQVQFHIEDQEQQFEGEEQRLEYDAPRCIGRAGTYHNPDPFHQPELVTSTEEFLQDHTPTTPVTASRVGISCDGSTKPYINLHKVRRT